MTSTHMIFIIYTAMLQFITILTKSVNVYRAPMDTSLIAEWATLYK